MSDVDAIRAVDPSGQLDDVLALPDHLRDALWRVESAGLEPAEASGLIVCGMGGSAIGGVLARAALGDVLNLPMLVFRDYELPPWTAPDRAVLCSSYSGEHRGDARLLRGRRGGRRAPLRGDDRRRARRGRARGRRAGDRPARRACSRATRSATGSPSPARSPPLVGAAPGMRTEIDTAAAHLEEARDALVARAGEIAEQLAGTVPLIYGCDLTVPVAYRWKCQINENAKQHAFDHQLPELDHNEIVGWTPSANGAPFAAVFLADRDQHPRQRERAELTAKLIEPAAAAVITVETEGETRVERLLWSVMLGDLVSLHLAAAPASTRARSR